MICNHYQPFPTVSVGRAVPRLFWGLVVFSITRALPSTAFCRIGAFEVLSAYASMRSGVKGPLSNGRAVPQPGADELRNCCARFECNERSASGQP